METFGLNASIVAGIQNIYGSSGVVYLFDSDMPENFNQIDTKFLIENSRLISSVNLSAKPNTSYLSITSKGNYVKNADVIAKYKGEPAIYFDGTKNFTAYPDHLVYYPKSITCKNDDRDHQTLLNFMYKQVDDYGYTGLDTNILRHVEDGEFIVFEYDQTVEVNCFGVKQDSANGTQFIKLDLEYWDQNTWIPITSTPNEINGYYIIKFNAVTSNKFRLRKSISAGTATVKIKVAFAYFGKIDYILSDIRINISEMKWGMLMPDPLSSYLNNAIQKQNDVYSQINQDTKHYILCSAGTMDANKELKLSTKNLNSGSDRYGQTLILGQIG
jgi:hypothetical protein